eukprot:CAMPEP_0183715258 /NCGR_PEP_ID=MMETSP0737-20130205/9561_1 /TAXON_ID=385413 /ORGANISM="Thalassiosira miniscula, Strain CCMP1093" /LENGTH=66 /DNA_ID=CAMNT_0025944347 /DNA_START=51 /DNA_END=251 /DNA_ORIENTATION=+
MHLKQSVLPALNSFLSVAKGMGMTAYDLARRHVMAFVKKTKMDENHDESIEGKNVSNEKEEQTFAA